VSNYFENAIFRHSNGNLTSRMAQFKKVRVKCETLLMWRDVVTVAKNNYCSTLFSAP